MSPKQKLTDLRQQLERWRSNNEVHAKPADNILYEFLSDLLKLADYDEQPESVPSIEAPAVADEAQTESDDEDEGGNSPDTPPDLP